LSFLDVAGAEKSFGAAAVLGGVNLGVAKGEFVSLLGPSGCGKTTLLRIVAGLLGVDRGAVKLDGQDITALPPHKRDVGVVFQNYALFPHLTVAENVAFGLKARGRGAGETREAVARFLDLVHLADFAGRSVRALSGGQQQRVAVARALAVRPKLLLLDEPFSALDRKLRETMQLEVRRLQRRLGLTTIFITHDQEEALVLSDRIAVMNKGTIQQIATTTEIYERPANDFVADFVGESNIFHGTLTEPGVVTLSAGRRLMVNRTSRVGDRLGVLMRPERFAGSGANTFSGEVLEAVYLGASFKLRLACADGLELLVRQPARGTLPAAGQTIEVGIDPDAIHVF